MKRKIRPLALAIESLEQRRLMAVGGTYSAPTDPRLTVSENPGWKFQFQPTGSPQSVGYNDSSWAGVALPHTFNSTDATSSPRTGAGWYRKTITVDASMSGKQLFLLFEGGSQASSLYIDGIQLDFKPSTAGTIDSHNGAFGSFAFDVTSQLTTGSHLLAVKTDSSNNSAFAPANGGDYSRQGGLYRDVSLVAVNKAHLAVNENIAHSGLAAADNRTPIATSGVYFNNSTVVLGDATAATSVKVVLANDATTTKSAVITSFLVDAAGVIASQDSSATIALSASQVDVPVTISATVANPHLWDGRVDPYRYTLYVEVRDATSNALLDFSQQKVGIRSFTINAQPSTTDANPANDYPFMLNGHRYTLVGADVHQDSGRLNSAGAPTGWAQTDSQIRADIDLLAEMGGTIIRTSHYQHNQAFYDYCDQIGVMVYTENSINGSITSGDAFNANSQDQYQELIRQNINHPSIFAWGFGNEVGGDQNVDPANSATWNPTYNIFRQLNTIGHTVDPSRKTGFSTYGGHNSTSSNFNGISDIKGTHPYDYWYGGATINTVNNVHNAYPSQPLGVGEFGGGASAYQYADSFTLPASSGYGTNSPSRFHPANALTRISETHYTELSTLPYLFEKVVWQMFDMASSGRSEGDQSGINDKGQVTRDRVRKDSFFFYKATWNDPARDYANAKVLKISDQFWTRRNAAATQVTVFSNIGAPNLSLNGVPMGLMSPLSVTGNTGTFIVPNVYVKNVTLAAGANQVNVQQTYAGDGQISSDTATWTYYNAGTFAVGVPVQTGVNVNRTFNYDPYTHVSSNPFNVALPNGVYDVLIRGTAGTSGSQQINNLTLEGQTATIDTNGGATADIFYARVTVTDGSLTLAGGPGSVSANVSTIDIRSVDTTPPAITSTNFDLLGGQTIRVQFSEDVSASIAAGGYTLVNITTGATIPNDSLNVVYSSSTNTATFTSSAGLLANGDYELSFAAGTLADNAGNHPATDAVARFFVLAGDFNRDRSVGFSDLLILSQNFGALSGALYAQGDATFDGAVNFSDLLILSQNFGQTLPGMTVLKPAAVGARLAPTPLVGGSAATKGRKDRPAPLSDVLS